MSVKLEAGNVNFMQGPKKNNLQLHYTKYLEFIMAHMHKYNPSSHTKRDERYIKNVTHHTRTNEPSNNKPVDT